MKLEFESNTSVSSLNVSNFSEVDCPEKDSVKIPQMLRAGIEAAQQGDRSTARQLLIQVTEAEPQNEVAWLWMASISEYPEELVIFLSNVLNINPNNVRAVEWMQATKSLLAKTFVERGTEAVQNANKDFAKQCFLQAIVHDSQSEAAWQALAGISDSPEEKIAHLQKAVNLNPANQSAKDALHAAKQQTAELILQKANRAAISGEREAAREMLQEVFQYLPEHEEAWILKSYLADSFSEKIFCFEKVLTLNPENETAVSGLASLREMMSRAELKKTEQAVRLAELEQEMKKEEVSVSDKAEPVFEIAAGETDDADADSRTEKLEFPPSFAPPIFSSGELAEISAFVPDESAAVPNSAAANPEYDNVYREPEEVFAATEIKADVAEMIEAKNDFPQYNPVNLQSSAPDKAAENSFPGAYEKAGANFDREKPKASCNIAETATTSDKSNYLPNKTIFPAATETSFAGKTFAKPSAETAACPFCSAENQTPAFFCSSCRTILTLSDLEMLLAHTEADEEILRQAVERMETERNQRFFSARELKNLAIGQINLKNLRPAIFCLQKAAQMSPNDVMLGSQINFLKIRLAEIEQHTSADSQTIKGKQILVVDDSATVRKLISSKLGKAGHQVICAVDGMDALEKINEFVPDLVLLDIMMPQIDGYQVCKAIRANELTKDVPIVMISGKDGFFDKVRGRMAGTTGYITKPFGPETLMKTVENYIVHQAETAVED